MKITLDGKQIDVRENQTVLDAARDNNIYIPTLCDNPHLPPFSGCRLCLVEIKGQRGYVPSCSTVAREGMEVKSDSSKLRRIRKQILELILSEHPSACLICQEKENCDDYKSTIRKVGETTGCVLCPNNSRCDLQDVVESLGVDSIRFPALYRDIEIKKTDPFFDRNYNLCILCGRCVRVCQELRGASAITFVYRGSDAVIGTALDKPLLETGCQFCGACVDVCPTGALTERSLKYQRTPTEKKEGFCFLCSMGCRLEVEEYESRILSSPPAEEGTVNLGQACVKGRFLLKDVVYSKQRIRRPMIRRKKDLEEVGWDEALEFVAEKLQQYAGDKSGFVLSSQLSCENMFLSRQFARDILKTGHIISRSDFSVYGIMEDLARESGLSFPLNHRIEEISEAHTIFLSGADIVRSHPIVWLAVLKAIKNGADLIVASPFEYSLSRHTAVDLRIRPGSEALLLGYLAKKVMEKGDFPEKDPEKGDKEFHESMKNFQAEDIIKATGIPSQEILERACDLIQPGRNILFLLGSGFSEPSALKNTLSAGWNLAQLTQGRLFLLGAEANERGLFEMEREGGAEVDSPEFEKKLAEGKIKALYLAAPVRFPEKFAPAFLIVQDSHWSEAAENAHAVLPSVTAAEDEGHFVNTEGRLQRSGPVIPPYEESRPDWWIIGHLAEKMGSKSLVHKKSSDIFQRVEKTFPVFNGRSNVSTAGEKGRFLVEEPGKKTGFLPVDLDLSKPSLEEKYPFLLLQDGTHDFYRNLDLAAENKGFARIREAGTVWINPEDATGLGLKDGESVRICSVSGESSAVLKITIAVPPGLLKTHFLRELSPETLFYSQSVVLSVNIKRGT